MKVKNTLISISQYINLQMTGLCFVTAGRDDAKCMVALHNLAKLKKDVNYTTK